MERAVEEAVRWATGVVPVKEDGVNAAAEPTAKRERAAVNFIVNREDDWTLIE
jgi:hypothetical protein